MARAVRIQMSGAWYHITARGNERRPIYRDRKDRVNFCELLAEAVARYRWRLHAYVLMENHYHLIVETLEANLSRAMHWLNVSYSVWFNRRHQRSGHLFQGRYSAIVVDRLGWGLELSRYVHLNPVRVGKLGLGKGARKWDRLGVGCAPKPAEVRERIGQLRSYRWSSYRAYIGVEGVPPWLTCESVRELVGGRAGPKQREAYRQYTESAVRQGLMESPWEKVTAQVLLGGAAFVEGLRRQVAGNAREQPGLKRLAGRPGLQEIITVVEQLKGQHWEQFRDRYGDSGRDMVLWLGRKRCGLKLKELAEVAGGLDYTSVSLAVKRFEKRRLRVKRLRQLAERAQKALQAE